MINAWQMKPRISAIFICLLGISASPAAKAQLDPLTTMIIINNLNSTRGSDYSTSTQSNLPHSVSEEDLAEYRKCIAGEKQLRFPDFSLPLLVIVKDYHPDFLFRAKHGFFGEYFFQIVLQYCIGERCTEISQSIPWDIIPTPENKYKYTGLYLDTHKIGCFVHDKLGALADGDFGKLRFMLFHKLGYLQKKSPAATADLPLLEVGKQLQTKGEVLIPLGNTTLSISEKNSEEARRRLHP